MACLQLVNFCETFEMADCVFGHTFDPPVDLREYRLCINVCDVAQLIEDDAYQLRVILKDKLFVVTAAHK